MDLQIDSPAPATDALRKDLHKVLRTLEETCRPAALQSGRSYFESGRARLVEAAPGFARGEVVGTDDAPYEVSLQWQDGDVTSSCTCPVWGSWDDHCKHVVALAYALDGTSGTEGRLPPSPQVEAPPPSTAVAPELDADELRDWLGLPKAPAGFVYDLEAGEDLALGIGRAERLKGRREGWLMINRHLGTATLDPADRRLFAALAGFPRDVEGRYRIPRPVAGGLVEALRGRAVASAGKRLTFVEHPAHLAGDLTQDEHRRSLTLRLRLADGETVPLKSVRLLGALPTYLLHQSEIHRLETGAPMELLEKWQAQPVFVFKHEETAAMDLALAGLRRYGVVLDAGADVPAEPPKFALTLDGDAEGVRAMLAVKYGPVELPLSVAGASTHVTTDGRLVRRDPEAEQRAITAIERAGLDRAADGSFAARFDRAIDFWTRGAATLPSDWALFGPQPAKVVKMRPLRANFALKQGKNGWFELDLSFASDDQSIDLARLRPVLQSGRRYVSLGDGAVGELPRELSQQLKAVLEETGAEPEGSELTLAPYEAGAVERLVELVPEAQVALETRQFLAALRDIHGVEEVPLPAGLKAELRPYQRRGLDWLWFLQRYGLGGVLADDMGLGKTLQALALILKAKKDEGKAPSLVIAPTSVITNWAREAERFTPSLKVLVYDGPDRHKKLAAMAQSDLVLTSYAILRRDTETLHEKKFRFVVLDEAQHIKNAASLGARAARGLQAERRLALTGTPIENRLSELWSLFDFLMPGFLGGETQFRNRYARPIEVDGDAGVRDRLKRRVHPFILRRLKDEVARDLPPRTDSVMMVELSPGQQALYREMLTTAKSRIDGIIQNVGFKRARIGILSELLRLRQICCDPRLLKLPPGSRLPPSAKLDSFGELVKDLIDEGHRALVFSQFTEMLGHLTAWADEEGIRYEYLDGKTTDRQERIDRFNAKDGPPLFFISLKAGGTGLNLTAADYVIHYDPWWNPAVEQQATDRAHRIGQTRPVFSYKLIAKGTVEEKIVALQEKKKHLTDDMLEADDAMGKVLSEKDVEELFKL